MSDFNPGGGGMWTPEQFTRPLDYPTSKSPQAGFEVAAGSDPLLEKASQDDAGPVATPTDSNDLQARLHALVTELRRQQPHELAFLDHPELRRLRSDLNHLTVIVEMAVEVALHAAEKAESR